MLIVDNCSKHVEIAFMNQGSDTRLIISILKFIFARHDIPCQLMSEGVPPFNSKDFKIFLISWDTEHLISSPYYPKSNRLVERTIGTIKKLLLKSTNSNSDTYIVLLQYRYRSRNDLYSPAELLKS